MSDQNYTRSYRASDTTQRGASGGGGDPLAELARLIGQSDPFAEFGRSDPRRREQAQDQHAADSHGWHSPEPPRDDFAHTDQHEADPHAYAEHDAAEAGYETNEAGYEHDQGHDHDPAPRARGIRFFGAAHDSAPAEAHTGHADQGYAEEGYAEEGYAEEQGYSEHDYAAHGADSYAAHGHGEAATAEPEAYADHERQDYAHVLEEELPEHAVAAAEEDPEYSGGPPWAEKHPLAPAEYAQGDEPRARRRGGMLTVVAVLGLAFMGTAGAFTYRAMVGGTGTKAPPVIKASTAPVKVVPATQAADPSKAPDRVGDAGAQNERVVPQEEQPVNLQEAATPAPPRPVFPDPVAPSAAPSTGPALPPSSPGFPPPVAPRTAAALPIAPAAAPAGASEPKKVHTVTIRPDGDPGGRPAAASPPPARTANAAPGAASDAPPRATAPARAAPQPPAQGNSPLSLAPGAAPPPAAAPHTRAPAATRTASVSSEGAGGAGAYAAQISSQRSEAEAHASFRSLKHKYGNLLGDREPIIRKVNIPGKGIFYRALVGGFASAQDASHFCSSLVAAGGQCLIQKN